MPLPLSSQRCNVVFCLTLMGSATPKVATLGSSEKPPQWDCESLTGESHQPSPAFCNTARQLWGCPAATTQRRSTKTGDHRPRSVSGFLPAVAAVSVPGGATAVAPWSRGVLWQPLQIPFLLPAAARRGSSTTRWNTALLKEMPKLRGGPRGHPAAAAHHSHLPAGSASSWHVGRTQSDFCRANTH